MTTKCSCVICKNEFSIKGFHSHFVRSHTKEGNEQTKLYAILGLEKSKEISKLKSDNRISNYNNSPNYCLECNSILPYNKRKNQFCSSTCSALYTSRHKDYNKIKTGPPKGYVFPNIKKKPKFEDFVSGEYTRVYLCKCKISGILWYSKTVKTIHPSNINTKELYGHQCKFNFNIFDYPEWFEYSNQLIFEYGWYSPQNKGNNLSGCSRDHMYSISEGFKNNIDPNLIRHPANCEIIPHKQNQSKNSKSKVSLEELIERIKLFEEKYPRTV